MRSTLKRAMMAFQRDDELLKRSPEDARVLDGLDSHFEPFNRRLGQEWAVDLAPWE